MPCLKKRIDFYTSQAHIQGQVSIFKCQKTVISCTPEYSRLTADSMWFRYA